MVTQIELGFRPESRMAATVMSFNKAGVYPQLYLKDMRVDGLHLNARGAEEFSRLVAENFSQLHRAKLIR
jgi:hypothetical protein